MEYGSGSSSDGVISSVEYGLAYNWVVDVLFMVETPPVFFVSMASIQEAGWQEADG